MIAHRPNELISLDEDRSDAPSGVRSAVVSSRQLIILHWLVILLVTVVTTREIWAPALLWGHSAWFDFARMVELNAAIRAGEFWPSWSPDLYHGYGSPLFQFYAPLVYFLTEIPLRLGLEIPAAFKVTDFLVLFGSGIAMYQLASTHVSRWAACLGALFYMLAPYRMADLFVRHALAENAAFLWLPLLVWAIERFVTEGSRGSFLIGGITTAGLILTHNIMAMIGLPFCLVAGWCLSLPAKNWRTFLLAGTPVAIGLGLAAFFWWPALSGRNFIRASESLTSAYFDYHRHFVSLWNLIDSSWPGGLADPSDAVPLQIGLPHLFAGVGALGLIFGKRRTRWSLAGVGMMAAALFFCLPISRCVWEAAPLLAYVQFPWRFLGLAVFGSAICASALLDRLASIRPHLEIPSFLLGLGAILAVYYPCYTTPTFVAPDGLTNSIARVDGEQVDALVASGRLLSLDRLIIPATMRTVGERATSGDDFLPRGVVVKPSAPAVQPLSAVNGRVLSYDRPGFNRYSAKVSMTAAGKVELQQFWFPGWTAMMDGRAAATAASGSAAIVSSEVPAGDHRLDFEYHAMPQRRAGLIVSLLSLALAGAIIILLGKRPPHAAMGDVS